MKLLIPAMSSKELKSLLFSFFFLSCSVFDHLRNCYASQPIESDDEDEDICQELLVDILAPDPNKVLEKSYLQQLKLEMGIWPLEANFSNADYVQQAKEYRNRRRYLADLDTPPSFWPEEVDASGLAAEIVMAFVPSALKPLFSEKSRYSKRVQAARALGKLPYDRETASNLLKALRTPDWEGEDGKQLEEVYIEALASWRSKDADIESFLIERVIESNFVVREIELLGKDRYLTPKTLKLLKKALRHSNLEIVKVAANIVASAKISQAEEIITPTLEAALEWDDQNDGTRLKVLSEAFDKLNQRTAAYRSKAFLLLAISEKPEQNKQLKYVIQKCGAKSVNESIGEAIEDCAIQ